MDNSQEELYGLYFHCKQPKRSKEIDEFIQFTQRNVTLYASYLEWIPYNRFEIVSDQDTWWNERSYVAK
ncbi:13795_t:CDS:2 [Funneliformis mosseae]|uniref:13795_t:CDS:1 n=1 Tax=Funneliformis mosseae TaxID=27381 RepID=A0A9N9HKG1_FUNMO|nr:13795_t:CDS:2 [Funneliformis mosseae]